MKQKASFTVEASLVIPLIFFVVWSLVQLSFFVYNREAAQAIAALAVLKGARMETETKSVIKTTLNHYIAEETEEKLLFTKPIKYEVKISSGKIKVSIEITQKTIYKPIKTVVSEEINRQHPTSFMWSTKQLEDFYE